MTTPISTMPFSALRLADKDQDFVNPRRSSGMSADAIRELALHIGFHDIMNALLVTADGLILAGQRRYRAIEWLIEWFTPSFEHHALTEGEHDALVALSHEEISTLERRAAQLARTIPVRVVTGQGIGGLALADNLLREQLSSFEIAAHLAHLHDQGATGAELARLIGKSKTYVSRALEAWRGAGPELKLAWEAGTVAFDAVKQLAELPHEAQAKALAGPTPRGRRGPADRPPIEMVKDTLRDLGRRLPNARLLEQAFADREISDPEARDFSREFYREGVLDALRWVAGDKTSTDFAHLVAEDA